MRDFLPEDVRRREHVIGIITRVYERYGFEPLETPAVENILLASSDVVRSLGGEGESLQDRMVRHEAVEPTQVLEPGE